MAPTGHPAVTRVPSLGVKVSSESERTGLVWGLRVCTYSLEATSWPSPVMAVPLPPIGFLRPTSSPDVSSVTSAPLAPVPQPPLVPTSPEFPPSRIGSWAEPAFEFRGGLHVVQLASPQLRPPWSMTWRLAVKVLE